VVNVQYYQIAVIFFVLFFKKVTNGKQRGEKLILKPNNKLSLLLTNFSILLFLNRIAEKQQVKRKSDKW